MTITGDTVFVGDSIMVGLPPFVAVDGQKISSPLFVKGGRSTVAMLFGDPPGVSGANRALSDPSVPATLAGARNMVVLGGTNDIAGGLSAQAIFFNLVAIWTTGSGKGLRVIALTIPPIRGYAGYPNPSAAEAKRKAVNAMIRASTLPVRVLDCDAMMGDGQAFPALLPKFDGGDHLHPQKAAMGAAMNAALADLPATSPKVPNVAPSAPGRSGGSTAGVTAGNIVVVGVGAAVGVALAKWKGWF